MKISSAAPSTAAGRRNRRLNCRSPSGAPDAPAPGALAAPESVIASELRLAPASAPWRSSVPDMRWEQLPRASYRQPRGCAGQRLAGSGQLRHVPGAMRSTCTALLLVTLVAGCKSKKPDENAPTADKPSGSASGAAKPADDMKPEPVGKDPGKPADTGAAAPAAPSGGGGASANDTTVRPPTAGD